MALKLKGDVLEYSPPKLPKIFTPKHGGTGVIGLVIIDKGLVIERHNDTHDIFYVRMVNENEIN